MQLSVSTLGEGNILHPIPYLEAVQRQRLNDPCCTLARQPGEHAQRSKRGQGTLCDTKICPGSPRGHLNNSVTSSVGT